ANYRAARGVRGGDEPSLREAVRSDLTEGMDARDWGGPRPRCTDVCSGIVKVGASYHGMSTSERRWVSVGAEAARRTGVPIAVHCEIGTAAHAILDFLVAAGGPESRVMPAHLDRKPDVELQ